MVVKKIEFIKKINEYGDVYSFYFKRDGLDFEAGQFCHLLVEDGKQREVRDMSFASTPQEDFLVFTMHVDSGTFFKTKLMSLTAGDEITLFKIVGKLKIDKEKKGKHIFLSGGVGLTPFRSIIKNGELEKEQIEVIQIQRGNYLYKEELENLVNKYHSLTPEEFEIGITEIIEKNRESNFYICGSKRFVEGVDKIFKKLDINEENIQVEGFYKDKNHGHQGERSE